MGIKKFLRNFVADCEAYRMNAKYRVDLVRNQYTVTVIATTMQVNAARPKTKNNQSSEIMISKYSLVHRTKQRGNMQT